MPRTPKKPAEKLAPVADAILDSFGPAAGMSMAEIDAATRRLKRALVERMLGGELSHHLGYAPGEAKPETADNFRNGTSPKTVLTDDGPVEIAVPRDRAGTFAPVIVPKHARRLTGFDDKVLALYARGLSTREIQHYLQEIYAIDVSPDLISAVTDAVLAEVTAWQSRPLEPMYPVVFFDALRVKIRDEGVVRNKAVHVALAVLPDGRRDVLGIWIEQTEGATFWLKVFTDLKARGCEDILIAVTDGLKGLPDALEAAYPQTTLQTCIVHLIRRSLAFVGHQERTRFAAALRPIYTAASSDLAARELDAFADGPWGQRFPMVVKLWRAAWAQVVPFFAFPPEVRRVMYTTNAVESLHRSLRKILKTRGAFPSDDAAAKLIWLALRNVSARWTFPAGHWKPALQAFALAFGDRFRVEA
jgi:putative transposase